MSIAYGSESDLKAAVALKGPVSAAVDARSSASRVSPLCQRFLLDRDVKTGAYNFMGG